MPTIAAEAIPALIMAGAGGLLGGAGAGIGAALESDATENAAAEAARGPVRGGTARAGNKGQVGITMNPDAMERLGQTTLPLRNPVYGNSGAPLDLNSLFQPKQFGTGFQAGQYNLPR